MKLVQENRYTVGARTASAVGRSSAASGKFSLTNLRDCRTRHAADNIYQNRRINLLAAGGSHRSGIREGCHGTSHFQVLAILAFSLASPRPWQRSKPRTKRRHNEQRLKYRVGDQHGDQYGDCHNPCWELSAVAGTAARFLLPIPTAAQ